MLTETRKKNPVSLSWEQYLDQFSWHWFGTFTFKQTKDGKDYLLLPQRKKKKQEENKQLPYRQDRFGNLYLPKNTKNKRKRNLNNKNEKKYRRNKTYYDDLINQFKTDKIQFIKQHHDIYNQYIQCEINDAKNNQQSNKEIVFIDEHKAKKAFIRWLRRLEASLSTKPNKVKINYFLITEKKNNRIHLHFLLKDTSLNKVDKNKYINKWCEMSGGLAEIKNATKGSSSNYITKIKDSVDKAEIFINLD